MLRIVCGKEVWNCSKTARGPLAENFPPQQAPQICLPAQPVFEQTSFMAKQ